MGGGEGDEVTFVHPGRTSAPRVLRRAEEGGPRYREPTQTNAATTREVKILRGPQDIPLTLLESAPAVGLVNEFQRPADVVFRPGDDSIPRHSLAESDEGARHEQEVGVGLRGQ